VGRATPETTDEAAAERLRQAIVYQRDHFHETPALIIPCYASPRPDARALAGLASLGVTGLARLAARAPRRPDPLGLRQRGSRCRAGRLGRSQGAGPLEDQESPRHYYGDDATFADPYRVPPKRRLCWDLADRYRYR